MLTPQQRASDELNAIERGRKRAKKWSEACRLLAAEHTYLLADDIRAIRTPEARALFLQATGLSESQADAIVAARIHGRACLPWMTAFDFEQPQQP